jgi:hypothetical protein
MMAVVNTARLFKCRPSELMGIEDQVMALAFDLAGARRVIEDGAPETERVDW